jgi:hypothetical protein
MINVASVRVAFGIFLGAILCVIAHPQIRDIDVVKLDIEVEITNADAVCAKARSILTDTLKMSTAQADDFLTHPAVERKRKCLEVVFTEASSPTNGYRVHAVGSIVARTSVGVG